MIIRLGSVFGVAVFLLAGLETVRPSLLAQSRTPPVLSASVSGTTVTLAWSSVEFGVEHFVLEVGSRPGASDLAVLTYGAGTRNVTASGVAPGTYYLRMFAYVAGAPGPASNVVQVAVGGSPSCLNPPEPPRALVGSVTGTQLALRWTEPFDAGAGCPVNGYVLEGGRTPGASDLGVVYLPVTLSFSAALPEGTYYLRARAYNAAGVSRASNELQVVVGAAPGALQIVSYSWVRWPASGFGTGVLVALVRNTGGRVMTDIDLTIDLTRTLVYNPPEVPRTEEVPFGRMSARMQGHTYRLSREAGGRIFRDALGPGEVGCIEAWSNFDPTAAFPPVTPSSLNVRLTATGSSHEGLISMTPFFTISDVRSIEDGYGGWSFTGRVSSQSDGRERVGVSVVPMSGGAPLACANNASAGDLYPGESRPWRVDLGRMPAPSSVLTWPIP